MSCKLVWRWIGIAIAATFAAGDSQHPFHRSMAQVDFNRETGSLEVALCVFPDDLADALVRIDANVDLTDADRLDALAAEYVGKHFVVRCGDAAPLKLEWVGHEFDEQQAWLYFEFPLAKNSPREHVTIDNRIMFELFDDQQNDLFLQTDGNTRLLVFSYETTDSHTVPWKSR